MKLDPQYPFQVTLNKALTIPAIQYRGVTVLVYESIAPAGTQTPYILLTQPKCIPKTGSKACKSWECSYLITVVTSFPLNESSTHPMLTISESILERILHKELSITDGFQMAPLKVAMLDELTTSDANTIDKLRYIRVKVVIYQNQ